MSKLFFKVVIEDIKNTGCTDREVELLLDIYGRTIKKLATTLARKAYYELADFRFVSEVKDFSLEIEKQNAISDRYIGVFKDRYKTLEVVAVLERD
ncbi:hypothetical protein Megpolyxen_01722 (plasmid) [Candidatus Megaera polyxenophila]|nr:hypothetical protein Megpolyxen_01722 [Candidatus Megaera polyxenophila]